MKEIHMKNSLFFVGRLPKKIRLNFFTIENNLFFSYYFSINYCLL